MEVCRFYSTYSRGRSGLFIKKKNYRIVGIASVCVCMVDTIDRKTCIRHLVLSYRVNCEA